MSKKVGKILDSNLDVKCPWCLRDSKLKDWDDHTYAQCTNRDMKRSFMHLNSDKTWLDSSDAYFKCPLCKQWTKSTKLSIINTDDEFLKKLGGKPLLEVIKDE